MAAFFMSRFEEITLAILRAVAGLMLMQHGAQKILGLLGGEVAPTFSRGWFAGILELALGAMVALGLATRVAAFILSGEMAFAYFLVHAPNGFWPVVNRGELAALYCFVFLYLSARGSGRYSLDAVLARRRGTPPERRAAS
ncbi:MAG TPA: DoxX family protein [Longimicrobium sp.]|nr:DoxX family protein [Longimicrobium sp.]